MSVQIINHEEAIRIADNVQGGAPPTTRSFYDVFGTACCLLSCEDERTLMQTSRLSKTTTEGQSKNYERRGVRLALTKHLKHLKKSRREWFNASEITESAAQGCGSCSVLTQIIHYSFSGVEKDLSEEFEYSILRDFQLRRRPSGGAGLVETIQLFQPPGM
jgi:hypothetical protein